jgi:hypothetical protein
VVGKLDGGLGVLATLLWTRSLHHGTSLVVDYIDNGMSWLHSFAQIHRVDDVNVGSNSLRHELHWP